MNASRVEDRHDRVRARRVPALAMGSTRLPIDAEFTGMFSVGVGPLASVGRFVRPKR